MSIPTSYRIFLLVVLFALTSIASAQQPDPAKKKVPKLSSDDFSGGAYTGASDEIPPGWKRYLPDGCGLSIALPEEPRTTILSMPDTGILAMSGKNHTASGSGYGVTIGHVQASVAFGVKSFAEGFMTGAAHAPGISNLQYELTPGSSPGRVQMTGSWEQKGVSLVFTGFAEVRNKHAWSVLAVYRSSNLAAADLSQKAVASAKFDGPECLAK